MVAGRGVLFKNVPTIEVSKKIDALALAAVVERQSEHPRAQAVIRHGVAAGPPRCDVEFSSIPEKGPVATGAGKRVAAGTTSLMADESVGLGALGATHRDLADGGQTAGLGPVEVRAIAVIGIADAAQALAQADLGIERQNLGWPIGYTTIALLMAPGVFEPALGLVFRRGNAAITIAGSSALVAVNALTLTWAKLPRLAPADPAEAPSRESSGASAGVSVVTGPG